MRLLDSATRKAIGAHYTPKELARFIARRFLLHLGDVHTDQLRILDPACGDGELLLAVHELLPESIRQKTVLIGVEEDLEALRVARQRLERTGSTEFIHGNFLELVDLESEGQRSLFEQEDRLGKVDAIIANPPYVRTQVLGAEKARSLAKRFRLTGRIDLYQVFIVAMGRQLVPGGLLGAITSNRFLSTKGGTSVREFLHRELDLLEIIDLGDTRLFDAAVLPAIFYGRKPAKNRTGSTQVVPFTRIYEVLDKQEKLGEREAHSVYEVLEKADVENGEYNVGGKLYFVSRGHLILTNTSKEPWSMVTKSERAWLERVESRSAGMLREIAQVRVGIKTTADPVFIRTDWDSLPDSQKPESELLFPLISHDDVTRWKLRGTPRRKVLYTHVVENGKRVPIDLSKYPRARNYLQLHRERLESREYVIKANRKWYEIWVPQDPEAWKLPKLVFPDISPEPVFLFDDSGCIVDGNCYWITLRQGVDRDVLFMLVVLANSKLMSRYHELVFQNKLYAGRRRYLTQYVERYPIPDLKSETTRTLIEIGNELVFGDNDRLSEVALMEKAEEILKDYFGLERI